MFKVGDRVRRKPCATAAQLVPNGTLGKVSRIEPPDEGDCVWISWESGQEFSYGHNTDCLELHSPAPPMDLGQLAQMGMQNAQAYAQQRQQQGLGQQPVRCSAPWPCGKAHEDDGRCPHCDRNKYHAEAFHLRSELAVLKAEKARLADDLSVAQHNARRGELMEEEMQFYRRELSRVAPKLVVAHERNFNKKDPWR